MWSQIILLAQDNDTLKVVFGLTMFLLILQNFSTRIFCKINPRSNEKITTVAPLRLPEMKESVDAVERILDYDFKNKRLLEEALIHPSFRISDAVSYQRLAFLGDTVLDLAVSKDLFLAYPVIDQGDLTRLRSANVSNEKFARVAVRHGLYNYLRSTATHALDNQVREFTEAIRREEEKTPVFGRSVEAPKVLADIVESVAGAIYFDLNFDLELLWMKFKHVLEPIVTLEELELQQQPYPVQQPHPVTELHQLCQKQGKNVSIEYGRRKMKSNIDGKCVALGSAEQKGSVKVNAAEMALRKLIYDALVEVIAEIDQPFSVKKAKDELHKICAEKRWPQPIYTYESLLN
ncbi:ribonuclease 3-like protein 2 isoform X2 [Rosa chinensis]|uniref:ribonuclease 3-like protein 2 isoform X2 n=1 Tax=Rosa chinensis TaxID=74649 RepID=UPI000D088C47|nr:ribonuclease 3-like protein 2 isoform X2 [Rosa chinensis]